MKNAVIPTYTIRKNKVFFLSTQNRIYQTTISTPLRQILKKAVRNQMRLPENELVAMNRFIMGKDDEMDFANINSTINRYLNISGDVSLLFR